MPSGRRTTITTLCRRRDGLPLAVELAAARVRTLSPSPLLDHLDHQLDLVTGTRDAPARQRSLRATLTWSHALLDAGEQVLLRRLGVFAGGCRLEQSLGPSKLAWAGRCPTGGQPVPRVTG